MRRLATVAAALAGLIAPAAAAAQPVDAARAPNRLLVTGVEYHITLSHAPLSPGATIVQFHNGGADPHNLVIQKGSGGRKHRTPEHTSPGATNSLSVKFKPGTTYVFYCSLGHHRSKGMEAFVSVTR